MGERRKRAQKRYRKSVDYAVRVRLVPKMSDQIRTWHLRNGRNWKFFGRAIGLEPLMIGLLAWFLEQPEDVKRRVLDAGLPAGEAVEEAWNREMKALVDRGEMRVDEKTGEVVRVEPGSKQQAQQPQPRVTHAIPADPATGEPLPRRTRRRA